MFEYCIRFWKLKKRIKYTKKIVDMGIELVYIIGVRRWARGSSRLEVNMQNRERDAIMMKFRVAYIYMDPRSRVSYYKERDVEAANGENAIDEAKAAADDVGEEWDVTIAVSPRFQIKTDDHDAVICDGAHNDWPLDSEDFHRDDIHDDELDAMAREVAGPGSVDPLPWWE